VDSPPAAEKGAKQARNGLDARSTLGSKLRIAWNKNTAPPDMLMENATTGSERHEK
jgi:hypothetical protein